jgi:hypothetical protein
VETRILMANTGDNTNAQSIVLLVTYRHLNLLLMGDATALTEQKIEDAHLQGNNSWLGQRLAAQGSLNVLKVGHHGSYTSTSDDWLVRVQPNLAFISSDTREFNGTSLPRKGVCDDLFPLVDNNVSGHYYVDYDSDIKEHVLEPPAGPTTKALFTSLHRLKWYTHWTFKAYGTSWYLTINDNGTHTVAPACGWAATCIDDMRP